MHGARVSRLELYKSICMVLLVIEFAKSTRHNSRLLAIAVSAK